MSFRRLKKISIYSKHKGFLFLVSILFLFKSYNLIEIGKTTNVFTQESKVKSEPNLRSEESFRLHEGAEEQALDTINKCKKN